MAFEDQVTAINAAGDRFYRMTQDYDAAQTKIITSKNRIEAAFNRSEIAKQSLQNQQPGVTGDPLMFGAVYNGSSFDAVKYRTRASSMGSDESVEYRFGPGPAQYGNDRQDDKPMLFKRPDRSGDEISKQNNPGQPFARGCNLGQCGSFQLVGGVPKANEAGMYSSNMGQIIFHPNVRDVKVVGGIGVMDGTSYETGSNVTQTRLELPWQYYGNGLNAVQYVQYRDAGQDVSYPVAIGRGQGRGGWNISNITAHKNGLLAVGGQITGINRATAQLAAGLVPTAVCQMNSNEFALVTCWDTINLKGKVAVVALAGTPQNCYLGSNPATWENYRGEWRGVFPGMPSYGNISFMKIVGYVELPDNMRCPTSISASTCHYWGNYTGLQDNDGGTGFDLRNAAHRQKLRDTKYFCFPPSAVAIVASKEEQTLCYIDFGDMFKFYRDSYLVEPGVGTVGYNAGQFPPTFTENTTQLPKIIKTVQIDQRPTCVVASLYDLNRRFYVGTQNGYIRMIDMGVYPLLAGGQQNAASIREVGSVQVGLNPTWIAIPIRHAGSAGREGSGEANYFGKRVYENANFTSEIIVNCRGSRSVEWVKFNSTWTGGFVVRRLIDKRIIDNIWVEDQENHTTEHYEILLTDFSGKCVSSWRYGNHIWWDSKGFMNDGGDNIPYDWGPDGLAPDGFTIQSTDFFGVTYRFECGGIFPVPGKPVMGGFANVY